MKKKLPEITVNEWLEAEASINKMYATRPEGSITPAEYSTMVGCGISSARSRLAALYQHGKAERSRITRQGGGVGWVYYLKNGKK